MVNDGSHTPLGSWNLSHVVHDRSCAGIAHVAHVFHCGQSTPSVQSFPFAHVFHVAHVFPVSHFTHCGHVAHFTYHHVRVELLLSVIIKYHDSFTFAHDIYIPVAHVFPVAHVIHCTHVFHCIHCAHHVHCGPCGHCTHCTCPKVHTHVPFIHEYWRYNIPPLVHQLITEVPAAHVGQLNENPLIKLYIAPLVDAINLPLALVHNITTLGKLSIVKLHWNHPFPPDHSKIIPVVAVLLQFLVRNIVFKKLILLGATGTISNAIVTKNIHDRPRRNRAIFLNILLVHSAFICRHS